MLLLADMSGGAALVRVNSMRQQAPPAPPAPNTVPVVVAAEDVPRGTQLTADLLKTRDCPKNSLPPGALTNMEDVLDRVPVTPLVKEEVLLKTKLASKGAGRGLAALIPDGMRAVTILATIPAGVAGLAVTGNKVDVLLTVNGGGANDPTGGGSTTTLLQNVEILAYEIVAVDQRVDAPADDKAGAKELRSVTLLVTPDQAAKLDLGQNNGTLHLALRNPNDNQAADPQPTTVADLRARENLHLAAGGAAPGEPAPGGKDNAPDKAAPSRTDATGDPLPPGIIARLGSSRLFQPGLDPAFLTFSPDGQTLAAVGTAGLLYLWDVNSGKELQHFQTPSHGGWSPAYVPAAFSPDGKLVALGCADNKRDPGGSLPEVRVWETATGKERYKFGGLPCQMNQLQFHPSGRYLAAGGAGVDPARAGGSVQVFDLQENKAITPRGDFKRIDFLAYSSDGKSLTALAPGLAPGQEGRHKRTFTFCRWDADGQELARRQFDTDRPWGGALSPDGTLFASPTQNGGPIRLLDPSTGTERCRTAGKTNRPVLVRFSTDGKTFTASDNDGMVRVWGTGQGKLLHEFKGLSTRISTIALSPGGKLVALAGRADGAIHLYDTANGKELPTFPGHRGGPLMVAFAPDGKTVFTVSHPSSRIRPPQPDHADWSLRQWDPVTGKELRVTTDNLGGEVHWTCFSDDGRFLATITHEGTLRLWDTRAGKELRQWKVPTRSTGTHGELMEAVLNPVFAPDGNSLMASLFGEAKGYRWDVPTGQARPPIDLSGGGAYPGLVPGPDERTVIAIRDKDFRSRVDLLDATSGRVVRPLGEVKSQYPVSALSPGGYTLAVDDSSAPQGPFRVTLLEVASGRERVRVKVKDTGGISALAFSPDGKLLAAGGSDVVRLYHAASGREVARVDAYRGRVESLKFSPDGKWLAVAGEANTALVCDVVALTAGQMPEAAKLTAQELDALCDDLESADGAKAYRAVLRLAASGKESTPFLRERFEGELAPDRQRIARLIADLDNGSFEVREKASAALERLGAYAEAALTRALEETGSAEVRRRVERLLAKLKNPPSPLPSEELVKLRMVEALATSGTPEARDLIKELANGDPETRLTQAAQAALKRWDRRESPAP
jgi:Flp pilus assembly protein CpaB